MRGSREARGRSCGGRDPRFLILGDWKNVEPSGTGQIDMGVGR